MTPRIKKRLTVNYGVEQDADGRDTNMFIVRLVGTGVDQTLSCPVDEMTEDAMDRAVGRLKYIEKQKGEGCEDQLGMWWYGEIGFDFVFRTIKKNSIRFDVRVLKNWDEPLAIMNFRFSQKYLVNELGDHVDEFGDYIGDTVDYIGNFTKFIDDFESGVYPHLKPDPITPNKKIR